MKLLIIVLCYFIFLPNVTAASQLWIADLTESKISFTASYDGLSFEGQFSQFNAEFSHGSDTPDKRYLHSTVDVTSINTNSRDRDQAIAEPEWFYFKKFPKATFISQSIDKAQDNSFLISGTIKIRDQSKEISFPLTWEKTSTNKATASTRFELDRRDFNIGNGEWEDDETIGFTVIVAVDLVFKLNLDINSLKQ